ncbi:MAG: AMP-binding protein [Nocardioides sp.]|jgi:fatty-acyl-CoA synthase
MDSIARGETSPALLDETIGANFARTVGAYAERDALIECASGRRWTWAELDRDVTALAKGLLGAGIAKGDRVGIWAPNCAEWTLTQFATAKIGAILVNVNPAYRTHEFSYAVNQSGLRLLVAATAFKTSDYRAMIEETAQHNSTLTRVVYLDDEASWQGLIAQGAGIDDAALRERAAELTPDDPINIQYTSGTTGYPKGATLSHRNILNNGYLVGEVCRYTEVDRVAIPVPFYHCFGMVMGNLACSSHGAAMVIPAPGFDPALTLKAVADERCTSLYGVPTMFIAEWALPDFESYDLASVRTGIMAGSPCPAEMMKKLIASGVEEMTICYGMTETSPVSTQTRTDDSFEVKVGTVGRVAPHVEIKIVDPVSGDPVPRGEPGEFCTRGYSVMLGYWQDPEKTAEAIDADGWMHTGDLGVMDDDGNVSITGRIKDMVIRGGENVYPREIEEFLYTHPDVEDVQVVGVPDEKYGEELCAWIKLKAGADPIDADGVRAFATGKLAHYKIPRYVMLVEEFPMTVTGKIRKVQMREESAAKLGLA